MAGRSGRTFNPASNGGPASAPGGYAAVAVGPQTPSDTDRERKARSAVASEGSQKVGIALILLWAAMLLYGEVLSFRFAIFGCSWPVIEGVDEVYRLAVISDPQLTDGYSYHMRPGVLLSLTEHYSDSYMQKSFSLMQAIPEPAHGYLFLGDLFDGGRLLSDEDFQAHVARFQKVFHRKNNEPAWNVSGNHDVGLGPHCSSKATKRHESVFGPSNADFVVGNFSMILIDAPAIHGERKCPEEFNRMWTFVNSIEHRLESFDTGFRPHSASAQVVLRPRILVSHIPLFRPDRAPCGPKRGSRPMIQGHGESYSNLLSKATSKHLLRAVDPMIVFSGDDHDFCQFEHSARHASASPPIEYTFCTFSWLQGQRKPCFGMVSLAVTNDRQPLVRVDTCVLPNQIAIYEAYGVLALLSFIAVWWSLAIGCSCLRLEYLKHNPTAELQLGVEKLRLAARRMSPTVIRVALPSISLYIVLKLLEGALY